MRAATMVAALGGVVLLAAGTAATSLAPDEPSITLRYHKAGAFPQMVKIAGSYCASDHGLQARLSEQREVVEGFLATFTCRRS